MAKRFRFDRDSIPRKDKFLCGVVEGFYGRPWTLEQRKDLFVKLKNFGLNTYMYAPKDDLKHRIHWRELYTVEEAEHLTTLIQAAKMNGITFYYALSPGADISYSDPLEIMTLKEKLDQVAQFGCTAFALLFDDIKSDINETDKAMYHSSSDAQVSVTNEIYDYLFHPKFIFCPTEYCAALAVPNVLHSNYLNTVGRKLRSGIDVMWTGSEVISKVITVQSIQELSRVLHRPPLIWDNLYANDYDQKRLFLGPYTGRSTQLIPHLRGILANPNCTYEANFVPIHTLSQWSKCNANGKRNLNLGDSVRVGMNSNSEDENELAEELPSQFTPNSYNPKHALKIALTEWLHEIHQSKSADGRITSAQRLPPIPDFPLPVITNIFSLAVPFASHSDQCNPETLNQILNYPSFHTLLDQLASSQSSPAEPVDCSAPLSVMSLSPERGQNMQSDSSKDDITIDVLNTGEAAEIMQTELGRSTVDAEGMQVNYNDIALLVDLFYLPFEHGKQYVKLLQEFQWLISHDHLVSQHKKTGPENPVVHEWNNRATAFSAMILSVEKLLMRLMYCPNLSLRYDLYPYLCEIRCFISHLFTYVKWTEISKSSQATGAYEPWMIFGGITTELWRLLLKSGRDPCLHSSLGVSKSQVYTIRPYLPSDKRQVYDVCLKTCNDGKDGSEFFVDYPDLVGDSLIGNFLFLCPEFCFVVEDVNGICGYAVAAVDAILFRKKAEAHYLPELHKKYLASEKSYKMSVPAERIIASYYSQEKIHVPGIVYNQHPSILRINILSLINDATVPKRMLACILSRLKANGSHGAFVPVSVQDKNDTDFYTKLGFSKIFIPFHSCESHVFYMGKTF